jgi:hypothetical protein
LAGGCVGRCGCGATEDGERRPVGAECVVDGAAVACGAAVAEGAGASSVRSVVFGLFGSGMFVSTGPCEGGIGGFVSEVETFGCVAGACDSSVGVVGATDVEMVGPT